MDKVIEETLSFTGYFLEDNPNDIPGKVCGVYCAYACSFDMAKNQWIGSDIVYFGKSGGDIRGRVKDHAKLGDQARRTLNKGEKLIYCYAHTDNEIECEKALVAAHSHLERLANTQLTNGYVGPKISLTIKGDCCWIKPQIDFEAKSED
jgi:hypothetical protein